MAVPEADHQSLEIQSFSIPVGSFLIQGWIATELSLPTIAVHNSDRPMQVGFTNWKTLKISQ